jgi:hypothetical protein
MNMKETRWWKTIKTEKKKKNTVTGKGKSTRICGNISKTNKTHFIGGDFSYIIFISSGNIKILKYEIKWPVLNRTEFRRNWNSEARFCVVGANEYSLSQNIEIIEVFSNLRIYNCITVGHEHYVNENAYSSPINFGDVDTGIKLWVYAWFPFHMSEISLRWMLSPYWTVVLFLYRSTSQRTTNSFQVRSITTITDALWKRL